MHIDITDLELVRAICEQGSITRAAERIHMTQSAASWRLGKLETQIGSAIFERTGRGMTPNALGAALHETAQKVLTQMAQTRRDLRALQAGETGTIRITSECYTSYHWLPELLQHYDSTHPDVHIDIIAEATEDPLPYLEDGRIDVALVTKLRPHLMSTLQSTPLFEDEMVVLISPTHPWHARSSIEPADFSTQHVILYQRYTQDTEHPRPLPLPRGASPRKISTVALTTEAVIEMVRAGLGITVMASWAAHAYIERGDLVAVHIGKQGLWRTWHAAWRRDPLPTYIAHFIEQMRHIGPSPTHLRALATS